MSYSTRQRPWTAPTALRRLLRCEQTFVDKMKFGTEALLPPAFNTAFCHRLNTGLCSRMWKRYNTLSAGFRKHFRDPQGWENNPCVTNRYRVLNEIIW